jgi:cytochrome P450
VCFRRVRAFVIDSFSPSRPTNVLQEVFWKPVSGFNSNSIRWIDPFWMEEFDLREQGANMLWRLLVRNSDAKCLQKNVFFKVSDKNPVVCYDVTFFPGPKGVVAEWLHWQSYGSLQPYWRDARKYGSAVYYRKNEQNVLLLSVPEFVDPVFNSEAFLGRPTNKLLEASHTHVASKGTIGIADRELGAVWTALRKTVAGFASTVTPKMAARISDAAGALAQQFVAASAARGAFDPFRMVQKFTVDLYGEMAFGSQYEATTMGEALLYWSDHARNYFNGLDRAAVELKLQHIGMVLDGFQPSETSEAWYDVLLRERCEVERDVLKATMFDVMAYSLNNAFTVNYGLFLLGVRPMLQTKLYEELQAVVPDGRPLTIADLHRMPLLMKVVKEVNRAYPGGGGILSRQSFDTTEIDGKVVPAGTVAIVNSLLLHHDPRFYEKPNDFNPLRWADASLEALLDDTNRLSFVTYGAGRKSCPANRLAMMQQALTLAKIVATATFSYTPRGPPKVELGFGAMPSTPVQIVAHAR